jgi:hypothetical protein
VVKLSAVAASRCSKPTDAGWLEVARRGGGAIGIGQRRGGDGPDIWGPACQLKVSEEAV